MTRIAFSLLPLALVTLACGQGSTAPEESHSTRARLTEYVDPYSLPGKASVSPRFATVDAVAGTSGRTVVFLVTNTGYGSGTYGISCLAGGVITACATEADSLTIGGGATVGTSVTFAAGAVGTGTVSLLASSALGTDVGHFYVTVQAGSTPLPANAARVNAVSLQLSLKRKGNAYDVTATSATTVVDTSGTPVGGATVVGEFSRNGGAFQSGASARTSSSGVAVIKSSTLRASAGDTIRFCVTDVRHATLSYDASASAVTCAEARVLP